MTKHRLNASNGWTWVFLLVGMVLSGMGCGSKSPEEFFADAEVAAADSSTRAEAVEDFGSFLERHPGHESSPKARKWLAVLAQQSGDPRSAMTHYERLLSDYPQSEFAVEAQFMVAYIQEEYLKDFDAARLAYQRVIDDFPDSDLAKSASFLLPNVGRDLEEWVNFGDDEDKKK